MFHVSFPQTACCQRFRWGTHKYFNCKEVASHLILLHFKQHFLFTTELLNSFTATATVKFWDALTATTPVLLNTMVIDRVGFYEVPGGTYGTGLFCTIATAAADITVFFSPNS